MSQYNHHTNHTTAFLYAMLDTIIRELAQDGCNTDSTNHTKQRFRDFLYHHGEKPVDSHTRLIQYSCMYELQFHYHNYLRFGLSDRAVSDCTVDDLVERVKCGSVVVQEIIHKQIPVLSDFFCRYPELFVQLQQHMEIIHPNSEIEYTI